MSICMSVCNVHACVNACMYTCMSVVVSDMLGQVKADGQTGYVLVHTTREPYSLSWNVLLMTLPCSHCSMKENDDCKQRDCKAVGGKKTHLFLK